MEPQRSSAEQEAGPALAEHGHLTSGRAQDSDPVTELRELHNRLDELTYRLMGRPMPDARTDAPAPALLTGVEPEMDIYESDHEFLIQAAVPGVPPDKIHVEATAHTVTLSAETAGFRPEEGYASGGAKRHRRSRHSERDRYHFIYTLHSQIIPESVRAIFRHGMVEIHLPKVHTTPIAVSVPVTLHEDVPDSHSERPESMREAAEDAVIVVAREGSPGQKLGAAYVQSAGEDHATKTQSIGARSAHGRPATPAADRSSGPTADGADALAAPPMGTKQA